MKPLYFLSSYVNMTKSYTLSAQGEIQKTPYPMTSAFTSHSVQCSTIKEFHATLVEHSTKGHCLIKGALNKALVKESRAGSTTTNAPTWWVCLDLDGAPHKTPTEFMASIPAFKDVSYIVQYSASYGLQGNTKLSCHIFMLLSSPVTATSLKTWLMGLNLQNSEVRTAITLTRTAAALHWPIDITVCQNDKLIYIAPPNIIDKNITSILKPNERIQLVIKNKPHLDTKLLATKPIETLRKEARALLNELRTKAGLDPLRKAPTNNGTFYIQAGIGEAIITEHKTDEQAGFERFNLNGGDSWAYYHPIDKFDYIFSFKGEDAYPTKELLPEYYKECKQRQFGEHSAPNAAKQTLLAFRNFKTAEYYNGTWNPETYDLQLYRAGSKAQLDDFMRHHNKAGFTERPVPDWDIIYNPQSDIIVDTDKRVINDFHSTEYLRKTYLPVKTLDRCPIIQRVIGTVVSNGQDNETYEHFLNWLACIYQYRMKTGTAWLWQGTEGTGKQLIFRDILQATLGKLNAKEIRSAEMEDQFNAWLEKGLITLIDEIDVAASQKNNTIVSNLKNFITETTVTIRAMHKVSYPVTSYMNFIGTANKRDCPIIITEQDRRWNIGHYQTKQLSITEDEVQSIKDELPLFMAYIMNRKADTQVARRNIKNEAHKEMVDINRNSIDVTVRQIANGDILALWHCRIDPTHIEAQYGSNSGEAFNFDRIIKREIITISQLGTINNAGMVTYKSKLSRDEVRTIFQVNVGNMPSSPNKVTSMLKHHNMFIDSVKIDNKSVKGLYVEWLIPKKELQQIVKEIETSHAPQLRRVK